MRRAVAVALLIGLLAGCRSGPAPSADLSRGAPPAAADPAAADPAAADPDAAPPAAALPDPRLAEADGAGQAIVVTAAAYGASTATLTAYQRQGAGWRPVFGPWAARIGRAGFAPPGEKREGDGRTPSGAYGFDFFFGVAPDPGVRFEYRPAPDDTIIWDEDPASPTYNLWVDLDDYGGGHDPAGMYQPVAYQHGAVIAYNAARTPGLGSGIFLHATTGRATAGCVALPVDQLRSVLLWLDPARQPRIALGMG